MYTTSLKKGFFMKKFTKFFALYLSVLCISSDHVHAVSAVRLVRIVDLGIKAAACITLAYGMCKISSLLSDIRDLQFEQLMNCAGLSQDNASISYVQAVSEHVDALQRDTEVYTAFSLVAPKDSVEFVCMQDLCDNADQDDEDDDFEDFE